MDSLSLATETTPVPARPDLNKALLGLDMAAQPGAPAPLPPQP